MHNLVNPSSKPSFIKQHWIKIVAGLVVVAVAAIATYFLLLPGKREFNFFSGPQYVKAYSLVNDSISQSAPIAIRLPEGVSINGAQERVTFTPAIEGTWVPSGNDEELLYQPTEKLKLDRYYNVVLETDDGTIGKDFLIAADPEVAAIFPKDDTEAHENSEITIIFNRPMIPLTTLDQALEYDVPIEISPQTEGRFKWIGTRTLQFIPETHLIASAHYTVKVKDGFASLDGLPIAPFEHHFITRPVRYEQMDSGRLIYGQPFRVVFNQPVNIEKMRNGITVEDTQKGKNVDIDIEYGVSRIYNPETRSYDEEENKSILQIYHKKDEFGREHLWDFEQSYYLNIDKVYPEEGDIIIEESRGVFRVVTGIIDTVSASSDRTSFARPDFLDPQGTLNVLFFEEIDIDTSSIKAKGLTGITYGEKCKESEDNGKGSSYYSYGCQLEEDKKLLLLSFDASQFGLDEQFDVEFKKVKNTEGLQINKHTLTQTVTTYPPLNVLSTVPEEGEQNAVLTQFVICANSPLSTPADEDIDSALKVSADYEFKGWGRAQLVPPDHGTYYKCRTGEFETHISYGIMPEHEYTMSFNLTDHFDQTTSATRSFRSGKMPDEELNFFHFQSTYNVTTPDKTKLTYAVINMEYVNMHICELSAENMLRTLEDRPSYYESPSTVGGCINTVTDTIELPKRYWIKNHFQVDLADYVGNEPGHFVVTFSHPNYKERYGDHRQIFERSYITLTNLSVVEKKIEVNNSPNQYNTAELDSRFANNLRNLYWVSEVGTLRNIAEAQIELYSGSYNNNTLSKTRTIYTDSQGIAQTIPVNTLRGAVITTGSDSALLSNAVNKLQGSATAYSGNRRYVYTDRPIYRPGHEVFIKGISRFGYDGQYEIENNETIELKVISSSGQEVLNKKLTQNEYGTFDTSFIIDTKAPLGRYRIEADGATSFFEVEEFVPAPFKVEAHTAQDEYIAGDTLAMDVNADYYFGVPLDGGEVEYGIATQQYFFDRYNEGRFRFGSPWYSCYWECSFESSFLKRTTIPLESDGTAHIEQKLDFKELFKDEEFPSSKIFVFYVTVKNKNGEAVSTQQSVIVHAGEFYLGVNSDSSYTPKNKQVSFNVKSVDTKGTPESVRDLQFELNKVEWVYHKRREVDGAYYYRYEKKYTPVIEKNITTNKDGDWNMQYTFTDEGSYELSIEGTDSRGNNIHDTYSMYVWGNARTSIRPTNDTSLEIITDNTAVSVGDTADIVIQSPFEKAKALITLERGEIFEYHVVDVNQSLYQHTFAFEKKHIPSAIASVVLISDKAEIKHGEVTFGINTKDQELTITPTPNKDSYLPGERVTMDFDVRDIHGAPVQAELSVAVVDMSVLALKGNPKKNPVQFFYGSFPHTVSTVSNLKNVLPDIKLNVAADFGTKGGGGADPEDLASKKRGEFKETAFWQAVLETDANGYAQTSFTLPDNLTQWQIETVGVTKDTLVGAGYEVFTARKDLMVVPLHPRFVIPGDVFALGAKVFNQTDQKQKLEVTFESSTLELYQDKPARDITLAPNETRTIYFTALAPADKQYGTHTFTLTAANDSYRDSVEKSMQITRNNTYEAAATSGMSTEPQITEYVYIPDGIIEDRGELTINSSATLAVFLSEGLNSLLSYPYGCSEQVASKLDALAIVQAGLNLKNIGDGFELEEVDFDGKSYTPDQLVEIGLSRLYENQRQNGGFAYYPDSHMPTSHYLTLHVIDTLINLREAGYEINQDSLRRAQNFINSGGFPGIMNESQKENYSILVGYTLFRSGMPRINNAYYSRIENVIANDQKLNEGLSNIALVHLALLTNMRQDLFGKRQTDKVYAVLENSIDIDARGAYLPLKRGQYMWSYYETPIKNTALMLKTLVARGDDHELMDELARWLLRSRAKDGAWGTTNNTLSVIDAFTDYLVWSRENESAFTLGVTLNKAEIASYEYGPENILEQHTSVTPISQFDISSMNRVGFTKTNQNDLANRFYYDMSLKYFLPVDKIPPRDEGFTIERNWYRLDDEDEQYPVTEAVQGEVLKGEIKIISHDARNFVAIEDYIPAGVELVNFNLDTQDQSLQYEKDQQDHQYWYWSPSGKRVLRSDVTEYRDDRLFLFTERLPQGEYTYEYFVRVLVPGTFHHLPAVVSEMYFPENFGRTSGEYFTVKEEN